MTLVEGALVVPIYILATTSMGTLPEEAIFIDVIDGLYNITAKPHGTTSKAVTPKKKNMYRFQKNHFVE